MADTSQIDNILDELVTLPSLPSTVARIIEMLDDPDTTLVEVGQAIAADPSLSMKTLRLVNSAFYGLRDQVNSVERAAVLLGLKVVRNLVFTASVFDSLQCGEDKVLRHSVACGTAMRLLVRSGQIQSPFEDPEEAFMYGLLHDIGKIILQEHLPDKWSEVTALMREEQISCYEAEQRVLGADHAELGARLAQRWKLQEPLVAAIGGHHDFSRCPDAGDQGRAALIAVADALCYQAGFEGTENAVVKVPAAAWDLVGLTPESLQAFTGTLEENRQAIDDLVNLAS